MTNNNNNNAVSATYSRERKNTRVPLHKQTTSTHIPDVGPDYVPALVNMVPGMVERYQAAGYEFIHGERDTTDKRTSDPSQVGSLNKIVVNWGKDAPCTHAVWMKQRKDWYEEDQKEKLSVATASLGALRKQENQAQREGRFEMELELDRGNEKF